MKATSNKTFFQPHLGKSGLRAKKKLALFRGSLLFSLGVWLALFRGSLQIVGQHYSMILTKGTYLNGTILSKCMQHGRGLAGLAESLRQEIAAVYEMGKDIAGSTTFG